MIFLAKNLLWLKAFHVIFVICWYAGLFYLPRLFVYHAMAQNEDTKATLAIMEYKLYKYIMNPAMILVLITGILLLLPTYKAYLKQGWLHLKLLCVFLLIGYHHICGSHIKKFANNQNKTHKWYRVFNEIPTIFLFIIVIAVITKLSFLK